MPKVVKKGLCEIRYWFKKGIDKFFGFWDFIFAGKEK